MLKIFSKNELDDGELKQNFDFSFRSKKKPFLFLGKYTRNQIEQILIESGIISRLSLSGFSDIVIRTEIVQDTEHILKIYNKSPEDENLLIFCKLRNGVFSFKEYQEQNEHLETLNLLMVDWLSIQDPRIKEDNLPEKKLFPGQHFPGLHMLHQMHDFIYEISRDLGLDGLLAIPEYYHVAIFYLSKMWFVDPDMHGKVLAIKKSARWHSLLTTSRAVHNDALLNKKTDEPYIWEPSEMIEPFSQELLDYFRGKDYNRLVKKSFKKYSFKLSKKLLKENLTADK